LIKTISYDKQPVISSTSSLEPFNEIRYSRPAALPKKTSVKKLEGLSVRADITEAEKPNTTLRVIDDLKKVLGEKPIVKFNTLINYKIETPQIDTIIEYETDIIVGTDLNINTDDEEAKKICEEFANEVGLHRKLKNHVSISQTCGFGLLVRVRKGGQLVNIEEFDIATLYETYRDTYGNTVAYVQRIDGKDFPIKQIGDFVPLIFKNNGRSAYGLSDFHALAVTRHNGNRMTRPLVKALQSLDDVIIGTLENFAYPIEYHMYEGANTEQLEEEAVKYKDKKPGDVFFINRQHEIDRREPTQAKFDGFINHFKDILQHGMGFPLDMLTGDFSSRASSQTADSFFMRRMRSRQKYLVNLIKEEIFDELLRSLGWDEQRIKDANVIPEFELKSEMPYTPELVGSRYGAGLWTSEEVREFDKGNGLDLFDDDKIAQQEEDKKKQREEQFQMQKNNQQMDNTKKDTENKLNKLESKIRNLKESEEIRDKYMVLFDKLEHKSNMVREAIEDNNENLLNRRLKVLEKLEDKLEEIE